MKTLLLILVSLLIAAAAALYLNPELRHEAESLLQSSGIKNNPSTTFYKWRNADGILQYTQTPPAEGIAFEPVEARSDVNILPLPEQLQDK